MIESGNALGVPRIGTITTKKYNNHNVNFSFYHGQLNRNKYMVEKPFLHEKILYYSTTFLKNIFSIGLSHSVIWEVKQPTMANNLKGWKILLEQFFKSLGIIMQQILIKLMLLEKVLVCGILVLKENITRIK